MTGRLAGLVVAVTREGGPDDLLVTALAAAGAAVRCWPTLAFADPADAGPLVSALARLDSFDWVAFTSARAVDPVTRLHCWPGVGLRVAAVGKSTAARLRANGWPVDVVGDGDGSAGLVRALGRTGGLEGRKVLFPAGSLAGTELEEGLEFLGAAVERVETYQTLVCPPDPALVGRDLRRGVRVVVFSSPSAVQGLAGALDGELSKGLAGCAVVASGATTSATLREMNVQRVTVAESPQTEGIVEACVRAVQGR